MALEGRICVWHHSSEWTSLEMKTIWKNDLRTTFAYNSLHKAWLKEPWLIASAEFLDNLIKML